MSGFELYILFCRECSVTESAHSSGDYEDALDIPYQRLEEFADVLATKVLINSVAISRREHNSNLRVCHLVFIKLSS